MPNPFFYQSRSNVDVNDSDTDVFFDTMNVIVMENRREYERFPFAAIGANIGELFGSDDNCFADTDQLPQENRRDNHLWPYGDTNEIVNDPAPVVDSDVFTDTYNALQQENRKEYAPWPATAIDGNSDSAETDVFTLEQLPILARDDFFVRPSQFLDGNANEEGLVDSDTFTDPWNAVPQESRREYERMPFGSLDGGSGDGTLIVDSDTFSDTFQRDVTVRSDNHLWPVTGLDGNAEFGETDCFTAGFDLPQENRHEFFVNPSAGFTATMSDVTVVDSDSFTKTFEPPQQNRVDLFALPYTFSGGNASEDDASYYVFADTPNAVQQQNRRDEHAWPAVWFNDPTTDDPSGYIFTLDYGLPQQNRQDEFTRAFSAGHDSSDLDASYWVFADVLPLPQENRHEYAVWPTTAAGPNTSEDDASYTVFADTFQALPQENRHEYFVLPFGAAHDTNEDDPSAYIFSRWIADLPIENRHEYLVWPTSSQGDASETTIDLMFSQTFDVPQQNRHDEFMRPVSVQGDSSDDETFNQAQFNTLALPVENRHEYLVWPTVAGEVGTTEFTSGDAEFSDPRQLPQQNRVDLHLWPISSGADFTDRETGDVFFDCSILPVAVRLDLHEWPWSSIVVDVIVGIVVAGRIEALDAYANWACAIDCYANWVDATCVFAGAIEAIDGQ
jgi:hypothetical protein